jgi:hypothetical protein
MLSVQSFYFQSLAGEMLWRNTENNKGWFLAFRFQKMKLSREALEGNMNSVSLFSCPKISEDW